MARMFALRQWSGLAKKHLVKRFIRLEEGLRLVKANKATKLLGESGNVIAFDLLLSTKPGIAQLIELHHEIGMMGSAPTCAAISRAEVEANAGLRGKSKTADLSEDEKAARIPAKWRGGVMEDAVERAQAKVAVYNSVH